MGALRHLKDLTFEMNGFANPPDGYTGRSSSGEVVTWDSAMAVGVIFRCVALLSGIVAGMPLITYRSDGTTTQRATDRPEYALLHDAPMPDMTAFVWGETGMGHALLRGNWYSEIIRDQYLGLTGLKLLPPHRVTPRLIGGVERWYDYRQPDGSLLRLKPREVLHIPGLGYDGVQGYSVLSLMRDDVGLYRAAHSFGSNVYRNNARPAVVLQHPKALPQAVQDRLAAQMDRLRGSANAGKTIVLEDDMKFSTIGMSLEDAQFRDTRQFQVGELARWFGVPPHMVGDVSGSTSWGTGIEQQTIGFLRFTADSWLSRIEQQIKLQLFGGYPDLYAEFLRESLLKADTLTRFTAYNVAVNTGWLSRAEVRARENLNPADGLDEFVLPVNIAGITTDTNGAVTGVQMAGGKAAPTEDPRDAALKALTDALLVPHTAPVITVEPAQVTISEGAVRVVEHVLTRTVIDTDPETGDILGSHEEPVDG
jgi:HK97 family phage portal protein